MAENEEIKEEQEQAPEAGSDLDFSGTTILNAELGREMQQSFLEYSMSVIIARALPDVRDGLKPVHRRILYAMNEAGTLPTRPHVKSARTVGDVIGKYHPHGDSAVYDTMVRLAQPFNMSVPLVDGHGNFGSIDGDSAAAMRYTEARLAKPAMELLEGLKQDTVDWQPNYDESLQEPVVLPARFPNLLVNGSAGIAVGMATNIPPHNLSETIEAACMLLDNPDVEVEDLMKVLPGPDFPTGGTIMGRKGIVDAYTTGKGSITIRSKYHIEEMENGITLYNDTYNANPQSMKAALGILANARAARKVAVVGDMLELEPFAERLHREVGAFAAELPIDTLVTVGTRAGWLAEAALESGMEDVRPCEDKEQAKTVLAELFGPDTAFLFKASRGMALEELCGFCRKMA